MQVIAEGLSHRFPGTAELFQGLSFRINPGEMVGLIGPSGSGKSTLLSLLAGWVQPLVGTITWEDIASVGWVFQNPHGVPGRTAIDHVSLPFLAQGLSRAEADSRAMAMLARFNLGALAHRPYAALSGGEAQRLMLARAMAKSPDLLLVDEPTAQLDPVASATVNQVLGCLADEHTIVVVATHDQDTATACDHVIDLSHLTPSVEV